MNAADPARDEPRPRDQELSAAGISGDRGPRPRDLARQAAAELARLARVAELADGAAQHAADHFKGNLFTTLMAHETALSHRLAMRFGAMADQYLDFTSPSVDPHLRQLGRDSQQFAGIAARLSERVRQASTALWRLDAAARAAKPKTRPYRLCGDCGKAAAAEAAAKTARQPDRPRPLDLAQAAAGELAREARVAEIADRAAHEAGGNLFATFMAHELALNHRLGMRFGAMADLHLDYTSATIDADRRQVGRDAMPYAAISARLIERVRQAAAALAERAAEDGKSVWGNGKSNRKGHYQFPVCARCNVIFNEKTGRFIFDRSREKTGTDRPDGGRKDGGGKDEGGNGSGGTGGASVPPAPADPAPPAGGPPSGPGGGAMKPAAAPLRRGRLNNNNPVGDYARAPRCGACTRAGGDCRQPAMANGRCRFHGGKSSGPRTPEGLARSSTARLRHGRRSAPMIQLRSAAFRHGRRLVRLTRLARDLARPNPAIPAGHGVDRSDWPRPLDAARSDHIPRPPMLM